MSEPALILWTGLDASEVARLESALAADRHRLQPLTDDPPPAESDILLARVNADSAGDAPPWPEKLNALKLPIIALVPAARPQLIETAVAAGALEVLLTPIAVAEARLRIRKVLRLRALETELRALKSSSSPDNFAAAP